MWKTVTVQNYIKIEPNFHIHLIAGCVKNSGTVSLSNELRMACMVRVISISWSLPIWWTIVQDGCHHGNILAVILWYHPRWLIWVICDKYICIHNVSVCVHVCVCVCMCLFCINKYIYIYIFKNIDNQLYFFAVLDGVVYFHKCWKNIIRCIHY